MTFRYLHKPDAPAALDQACSTAMTQARDILDRAGMPVELSDLLAEMVGAGFYSGVRAQRDLHRETN